MGGERLIGPEQPGGRAPAPGQLALVQAFINSHYDLEFAHGADLLATPMALAAWLRRHELLAPDAGASAAEHARAIRAREHLRELARARGTDAARRELTALGDAARGAAVEVRLPPSERTFAPAAGAGVAGALGVLIAITAESLREGSFARLKICPGADCGWAFYDHSRNQTGRWCSMSVCGGRAKARTHYRRRRDQER